MVKPLAVMMLGSHVPRPMATPKNAEKQIMPAITRFGNMREDDAERIALGVARGIRGQRLGGPGDADAGRARRAPRRRGRGSPDSAAIPAA